MPDAVDKVTIRNRTRQIASYLKDGGHLPAGLCDIEPEASFGATLLLAADRQLVTVSKSDDRKMSLRVKLPIVAMPAKRSDWAWVVLTVSLPDNVPAPAEVKTPTLRLVNDRVRVDLPWVQKIDRPREDGHTVGFAYDWGVNTFMTGALCWVDSGGAVHTDGKPFAFRADAAVAKVHRLRRQREVLHAKVRDLKASADGLAKGCDERERLLARAEGYEQDAALVSARQRHLNSGLAWAGARWVADQARANRATVIYPEDLSTLERGASHARPTPGSPTPSEASCQKPSGTWPAGRAELS